MWHWRTGCRPPREESEASELRGLDTHQPLLFLSPSSLLYTAAFQLAALHRCFFLSVISVISSVLKSHAKRMPNHGDPCSDIPATIKKIVLYVHDEIDRTAVFGPAHTPRARAGNITAGILNV